jgi:anti-anti-sigma factor
VTADSLVIETRAEPGCTVIALAGELDLQNVGALEEALNACTDGLPVIVDITELVFILSAGLHALIDRRREVRPAALVYKPGSSIARVLEIVQARRQVPLFDELASARQELADTSRTEAPVADRRPARRKISLGWS